MPEKYDPVKAILANLPAPTPGEPPAEWERLLDVSDRGRVQPTMRNAYLILRNDERWREVLAYDWFADRVVKREPPPYEGSTAGHWDDVDEIRAGLWLAQHYRVHFEPRVLMRAVIGAAHDRVFHPVRDYLSALRWDGRERLSTWLVEYLGAKDSEYARAVARKWMIAAVARVMRPGCKVDNVLILEGPQGRWKSSALKVLAGEWFLDTPFTLGDRDSYVVIRGAWIVELAELDGFTRAESSRAKAFFSQREDTYVPKYLAWRKSVPRQCVFAGTVNHGTYLRDTTGNRRYWPVSVTGAHIDLLAHDRDQLWAEARVAWENGERWWVEQDEQQMFREEQALRYVGDAYEDVIAHWLKGRDKCTMSEILEDCLKIERAKWTRAEQIRVGEVMAAIGWRRVRSTSAGERRYHYEREEREPGED